IGPLKPSRTPLTLTGRHLNLGQPPFVVASAFLPRHSRSSQRPPAGRAEGSARRWSSTTKLRHVIPLHLPSSRRLQSRLPASRRRGAARHGGCGEEGSCPIPTQLAAVQGGGDPIGVRASAVHPSIQFQSADTDTRSGTDTWN
ncbi:Gamma-aminobutyrate transaminase POP2 mitochondrial, partial [Zea mays]